MTTSFWLNNPNILFKSDEIYNIWPSAEMNFEAKLNAMSRLVLLLTIVGYFITKKNKILLSGLITLGAIILLFYIKNKKNTKKEGYENGDLYNIMSSEFTKPTTTNPAMNILLPEINDNGNLILGLGLTLQRKGGDNGAKSANDLQFKINPMMIHEVLKL